jgi:hypothetical protein
MMGVLIRCGRAVPLRYPADVDSRRFPGVLKLNLDVRGAGLLRREDNRRRPAAQTEWPDSLTTREVNR